MFGVSLIIFSIFRIIAISGCSMETTYQDGDVVVIFPFGKIDYGDIVVFDCNGEKNLIKRVIGKENDVIDITDGKVYRNGEELNEPYINAETKADEGRTFPYTVSKGEYFVLGDNRGNSRDSRDSNVTCTEDNLKGRVLFKVPF